MGAGFLWLMRPNTLARRFKKMVRKNRRRLLFSIILMSGGVFATASRYAQGFLAKLLLIFAVITVLKALFFASSKAADKIIDWWLKQPLWVWRMGAAFFMLMGYIFIKIK
ncbi:MAG: hypothetical protein ABH952_00545 [Candidatus Omnitrophota bacterium]